MPAISASRTGARPPCPGPRRPASARSATVRPPQALLDLGAVRTGPASARAWTREILREWRLTDLSDVAQLVVSELVTNAVAAARGRDRSAIRLILTVDRSELVIRVRDGSPGVPRPRNPGSDDVCGRGLLMVETLCDRTGWYPREDGAPGKVVWAAIASRAGEKSRFA